MAFLGCSTSSMGRRRHAAGTAWLERRFLALVNAADLGALATQQVLTRTRTSVVRVDCRFEDVPLVVELLGYRWHRSNEQLARDAARVNALQLAGFVVLQFTYDQVALDPDQVIEDVRLALTQLRNR